MKTLMTHTINLVHYCGFYKITKLILHKYLRILIFFRTIIHDKNTNH